MFRLREVKVRHIWLNSSGSHILMFQLLKLISHKPAIRFISFTWLPFRLPQLTLLFQLETILLFWNLPRVIPTLAETSWISRGTYLHFSTSKDEKRSELKKTRAIITTVVSEFRSSSTFSPQRIRFTTDSAEGRSCNGRKFLIGLDWSD